MSTSQWFRAMLVRMEVEGGYFAVHDLATGEQVKALHSRDEVVEWALGLPPEEREMKFAIFYCKPLPESERTL